MLKIIADSKIPFLNGVLEPFAEVQYLPGAQITPELVRGADALITRTRTKCNAALLEHSQVKLIATATIGYDHIDTDFCARAGIRWVNAPGCNSSSVAQYITSLLLCDSVKNALPLAGKTIGVVGVGNVGSKVAASAAKLGMKVLLNDPPRARKEGPAGFVSLDTICAEADYITFHTPLIRESDDKTYHLANEDFFHKLVKHPFLINSSRGEVVATDALKGALITRRIRGGALDVWENEPDIDLELLGLLHYATPHIAGYSADGKANGTAMAVRAVSEFFCLPLHDFYPSVPAPESPLLTIQNPKTALYEAVTASYDIRTDDARFRQDPDSFEDLRGNYPLRREFPAFRIASGLPLPAETQKQLSAFGFLLQK